MVAFDAVVRVLLSVMKRGWHKSFDRSPQRRGAISHNLDRVAMSTERGTEESTCGSEITSGGDQRVDDLTVLINRSVHIPPPPRDLHVRLVHEPTCRCRKCIAAVTAAAGRRLALTSRRREVLHGPRQQDDSAGSRRSGDRSRCNHPEFARGSSLDEPSARTRLAPSDGQAPEGRGEVHCGGCFGPSSSSKPLTMQRRCISGTHTRDHPWSRTHAEHPTRALRTRCRRARSSAYRARIQRTLPHDLNRKRDAARSHAARFDSMQQCPMPCAPNPRPDQIIPPSACRAVSPALAGGAPAVAVTRVPAPAPDSGVAPARRRRARSPGRSRGADSAGSRGRSRRRCRRP